MPDDEKQEGQGKYNPESLEDAKRVIEALEKRIGERDTTISSLRGDLESYGQRLQAIEAGQQKKMEEEGNWKAIAEKRHAEVESLKISAQRAEALEAVIRQANEATIARIPETKRGFVPVDYPPEKLQGWLAANGAALINPPAPDFNAGEGDGGKSPSNLTDAERKAGALFGIDPKELQAIKERDAKQ